ncbi:hypothetical protein [Blautia obeum]|uniref:hypothetical protein n=1 Tax=Blautia obeum TaxID=40520 RepID=UPI00304EA5C5|nr:hypothetical protein [Lachnospiraceae bacterium]MCI6533440.1 hypothetical protein [Lachnospiraceae bacterium]
MTHNNSHCNTIEKQIMQLNKQAKSHRKQVLLNQYLEDYSKTLQQYMQKFNMPSSHIYLENYVQFFSIYKGKLVFSPDPSINLTSIKSAFQKLGLPTTPDCSLEKHLLSLMKKILNSSTTPYEKACNDYLIQYKLPNAIHTFIPYIDKCFYLIDNQLYYISIHNQNIFSINEQNAKELLAPFIIPFPNMPLFKRIIKNAIKEGLIPKYDLKSGPDTFCYFLPCKHGNDYYNICYNPDQKLFFSKENTVQLIQIFYNKKTFPLPQKQPITRELLHFLHVITKGNSTTLNNFAYLLSVIACPNRLSNSLFIISPEMKQNFDLLIDVILEKDYDPDIISLKSLIAPNNIRKYLNYHNTTYGFFYIPEITLLYEDSEIKKLKKLINGNSIELKDTLTGSLTYTNTYPIICIPKSHEETVYLKNNFKCIFIDMDTNVSNYKFNLSKNDLNWLQSTLLLFGMQTKPEIKRMRHSCDIKIPHDTIIEEFINTCCFYSENKHDFVYANQLYEIYLNFFQQNYQGTPLKRVQLVKSIKRLGSFEYKRPHVSRNVPNAYAFMNLCIRDNCIPPLSGTLNTFYSTSNDSTFYQYLEEISASIPDSFWDEINAIKSKYPQIKITYASNTYGNSYGNEDDT